MNIVDVDVSDREESRDNHIYWRSRLIAVLKSTTDGGMAIDDIVQSLSVRSRNIPVQVANRWPLYFECEKERDKKGKEKVVAVWLHRHIRRATA